MRALVIILLAILLAQSGMGQNVVGFDEQEVKEYFRTQLPHLLQEPGVKNEVYRYLKYTDGESPLTTVLVFLDSEGTCSSVRAIYDLSRDAEIRASLAEKYGGFGNGNWVDTSGKGRVKVKYKKEEWYITVSYNR